MTKDGRHSVIGALAHASRQRPPEKRLSQATADKTDADADTCEPQQVSSSAVEAERQRQSNKNSVTIAFGESSPATPASTAGAASPDWKASRRTSSKRKATINLAKSLQQEDLRIGEAWNKTLQIPANRADSEICQRFWAEMKLRIVRRYGSVTEGFKQIDTSGDGVVNLFEFSDFLNVISLPLESRNARAMFDKVSHGHADLSLEDLKTLLMEKTILKLQSTMRGFNKKQERVRKHVHRFMKHLAKSSDETLSGAVDRLQRKFTMSFCREFWQTLREHLAKIHSDGDLDRASFLQMSQDGIGTRFMAYEIAFLLRIFDRVDTHGRGCVHLRDLMTTLVLLSEESSKELKLHLLFDVFDTDADGCLLHDQILSMMQCICAHRPIVEQETTTRADKQAKQGGIAFQEELAAQDGLRLYECLYWYLQRTAKLDSPIVTWKELWEAFDQQPEVANAALPGLFHMQWILKDPIDEPDLDELQGQHGQDDHNIVQPTDRRPSKHSDDHWVQLRRRFSKEREETTDSTPVTCSTVEPKSRHEQSEILNAGPESSNVATSKCSAATRASIRASIKVEGRNSCKVDNENQAVQAIAAWEAPRETTKTFKRAVTNRFLSSLRSSGEVRYTELTEGFKSVEDLKNGSKDPDAVSQSVGGATTFGQVAALDVSRPASATGAQRFPPEPTRPGSSPGSKKPLGVGGKGNNVSAMSRCSSAPTGLDARGSGLDKTSGPQFGSTSALGRGSNARVFSAADLPKISSQRWGFEAADRFRLFSTVRSGADSKRHLSGACGGAEGGGVCYKCQLCQRQHTMVLCF